MSLLQLATGGSLKQYVDEVFSAYTYQGNGATQTITNGIDLAGHGGMVWCKSRSGADTHELVDTARGAGNRLSTNTTAGTGPSDITGFTSSGFTLGYVSGNVNVNAATEIAWTFRNAPKFYTHSVQVKAAGVSKTVDLSSLGTVGMVRVKRTDSTGSWYVWHRSLTAGKLLIGETTAAEATLGHITVSGTTVTLVDGVIADGTYLVEGFAHDTSADGLIQCGIGTGGVEALGWEPQFILIKRKTDLGDWNIYDYSRGFSIDSQNILAPNTTVAESATSGFGPQAIGIRVSSDYIYLAIRRPNKPPTSGTQVYNAIARTGTGAAATVTGVGFAPDLVMPMSRSMIASYGRSWWDRLRGVVPSIRTLSPNAEDAVYTDMVTGFTMDGVTLGIDASRAYVNWLNDTYINHFFKRAPGVFEEVAYTGTGANKTETHNLTVAPELWIVKGRSGATAWTVGCTALANTEYLVLNTTAAKASDATAWDSTFPSSTVLSLGTQATVNTSAATYVAYLFATLSGISKVFSYTGNGGAADSAGTSQTINCGFTTGARFVMLKCTSHTSDWVIVDTVRGLVAANDPALSLNTAAAEVTTTDLLDPDTSGFIVNQLATGTTSANFNVTGRTYIGLAVS